MSEKTKRKNKDLYLIIGIVIVAILSFLFYRMLFSAPPAQIQITADGTVQTMDLNQNGKFTITGANSGTNEIVIDNGVIYMSDASCPDRVCIHQGKISNNGEMIVCLPNQVIVQILGE